MQKQREMGFFQVQFQIPSATLRSDHFFCFLCSACFMAGAITSIMPSSKPGFQLCVKETELTMKTLAEYCKPSLCTDFASLLIPLHPPQRSWASECWVKVEAGAAHGSCGAWSPWASGVLVCFSVIVLGGI